MTKSFDEWFKEEKSEYPLKLDAVSCRKGYKAGAESRQAEIDELKKQLKYEESAYKNVKLQFLNKEDDYNELQKRIDDALKEIESGITGKHHISYIAKILKGESNER